MGVLSVQSCVNYKVKVVRHDDNNVFYIPTQRVGFVWKESYFAHSSLSSANREIKEWITKKQFIKEIKNPNKKLKFRTFQICCYFNNCLSLSLIFGHAHTYLPFANKKYSN